MLPVIISILCLLYFKQLLDKIFGLQTHLKQSKYSNYSHTYNKVDIRITVALITKLIFELQSHL